MGMFDTVLVSQSLIEKAIEDTDINLVPFEGYFNFQTKDLDNCLSTFYIQADGKFFFDKQEYIYSLPVNLDTFEDAHQPSKPLLIEDTRSAYIEFYELYTTDSERVFVTFTAHLKHGLLNEPITIKSVERTNLKDERESQKHHKEHWHKITSTWQWKVATFIFDAKCFTKKFFRPLTRAIDDFESFLREQAKEKNEKL